MSIKIRETEIGSGMPKICVPIVGTTREEIRDQLAQIKGEPFDLLEWRVDFFEEILNEKAVEEILCEMRTYLGEKPLLFTFRSKYEGGEREVEEAAYEHLIQFAAQTGKVDLIDVELFRRPEMGAQLQERMRQCGVKLVGSNHDFEGTPTAQEIVHRLNLMSQNGADIPKMAVMPRQPEDVLTLLKATWEFKRGCPEVPVITMAMGRMGMISRMAGEIFGSAVTFGSGMSASAPGQIPAKILQDILELLHEK